MNKRLKTHLASLKVQSFVTSLVQNEEKKIKGGLDTINPPHCPQPPQDELPGDTWGSFFRLTPFLLI
jgi:hypothetical protein